MCFASKAGYCLPSIPHPVQLLLFVVCRLERVFFWLVQFCPTANFVCDSLNWVTRKEHDANNMKIPNTTTDDNKDNGFERDQKLYCLWNHMLMVIKQCNDGESMELSEWMNMVKIMLFFTYFDFI